MLNASASSGGDTDVVPGCAPTASMVPAPNKTFPVVDGAVAKKEQNPLFPFKVRQKDSCKHPLSLCLFLFLAPNAVPLSYLFLGYYNVWSALLQGFGLELENHRGTEGSEVVCVNVPLPPDPSQQDKQVRKDLFPEGWPRWGTCHLIQKEQCWKGRRGW